MTIMQHTVPTPFMVGPVHIYTVEAGDELLLFDAGPATEEAAQVVRASIDLSRLRHIFITHCHVDHYGLLGYLAKESKAKIYLPSCDVLKFRQVKRRRLLMGRLLSDLGFYGERLEQLKALFADDSGVPPLPETFSLIEEDMPQDFGISWVSCPGHSQSDIVYFTDSWAVTGDTLLRGIFQTPALDIDLETGERFRNYEQYCGSLRRLYALRDRQICPAHRESVDGVEETLTFYVGKMLRRVSQLREYDISCSVAQLIEEMFEDRQWQPFHLYLKISELMFFKDFIENPELLRQSLEETGLFAKMAKKYFRALGDGPFCCQEECAYH